MGNLGFRGRRSLAWGGGRRRARGVVGARRLNRAALCVMPTLSLREQNIREATGKPRYTAGAGEGTARVWPALRALSAVSCRQQPLRPPTAGGWAPPLCRSPLPRGRPRPPRPPVCPSAARWRGPDLWRAEGEHTELDRGGAGRGGAGRGGAGRGGAGRGGAGRGGAGRGGVGQARGTEAQERGPRHERRRPGTVHLSCGDRAAAT
jgi:hypothetical protein